MSVAMLPSNPPDYAVQLVVPTPGDPVTSTSPTAPLNPEFQKLLDGIEASRLQLLGAGMRRRCISDDGAHVGIYPLGQVAVVIGGVTKTASHSTYSYIDFSAGLAADTRYYVYATVSGGAVAFSKSTTEPDDFWHFKTGDTAYLYVSTFLTDASAVILQYSQSDNFYSYDGFTTTGTGVHGNRVLDKGTATSWTGVITEGPIPRKASAWVCQIQYDSANSGDDGWVTGNPNQPGWHDFATPPIVTPAQLQAQITLSNRTGLVFYKVASPTYDSMTLYAQGFWL